MLQQLPEATLEVVHMCTYCRKIRDNEDSWDQFQSCKSLRSDVMFSHSICPDCLDRYFKEQLSTNPS